MANHRRQLKRINQVGHARYITCSCYQKLALLDHPKIRDAFVEQLKRTQDVFDFDLYAWVVMPNPFHLLLRPEDGKVTALLRRLKAPLAKRIITRWRELYAAILNRIADEKSQTKFWQTGGGYDRNITSNHELLEKIDYIHANPIRRGLVARSIDWSWSSAKTHAGVETDGPRICHMDS